MVFTDALQTIIMLVGAIFLAAVGEAIVGSNTAGNIGTRHAHEHDVGRYWLVISISVFVVYFITWVSDLFIFYLLLLFVCLLIDFEYFRLYINIG